MRIKEDTTFAEKQNNHEQESNRFAFAIGSHSPTVVNKSSSTKE